MANMGLVENSGADDFVGCDMHRHGRPPRRAGAEMKPLFGYDSLAFLHGSREWVPVLVGVPVEASQTTSAGLLGPSFISKFLILRDVIAAALRGRVRRFRCSRRNGAVGRWDQPARGRRAHQHPCECEWSLADP